MKAMPKKNHTAMVFFALRWYSSSVRVVKKKFNIHFLFDAVTRRTELNYRRIEISIFSVRRRVYVHHFRLTLISLFSVNAIFS